VRSFSIPADRSGTAGTVRAFQFLGVPVRLHFTFILLLLFLIVTALGYDSTPVFAIFILGLFASVLLHEGAHAALAAAFKIRTVEIVMFPIGGLSRMERRLRPVEELWISVAGPLANLLHRRCPGNPLDCIRAKHPLRRYRLEIRAVYRRDGAFPEIATGP